MVGSYLAPPDKAASEYPAIDAHYYNITDSEAWPVAGLLVLLDRQEQPVRAELHLYDQLPSHVQEAAVRQSRLILVERYSGQEMLPLRILVTEQMREAMDVRLPQERLGAGMSKRRNMRPYAVVAAMVGLAVALTWAVFALWGMMQPAAMSEGATPDAGQTPAASGIIAAVVQPLMNDVATLAPSRNARADIRIGMRVIIDPNYSLFLRSEAGAGAGEEIGYMANGAEALVIAGPELTRGDSDTIVWWYVRLDDGVEGWAPANTSTFTLLRPVE